MVTPSRWIPCLTLVYLPVHIAVKLAEIDSQNVGSVYTFSAQSAEERSARVALVLSGTMRGFCRCLTALQHTTANQGESVKLVLATYQNQDCAGGNAANVELGHGPVVTPERIDVSFKKHGLHLNQQSVIPFVPGSLSLPPQHLFNAWHGALERYYSQFFLRSKAVSLLESDIGLLEVVVLTRPDVRLTSQWRFESTDSGWALKILLADGRNEQYMLSPTTVVVPESDIHGGAPDDTLVAGTVRAIKSYVSLYDCLMRGAYADVTLPSSPNEYPEDLLRYHMSAVGLDVKLTYGRKDLLTLERACEPADYSSTCAAS